MANPERNSIRAAFGAMILVVGCGEVQPRAIPDNASAGVISEAPPKPTATSIRPAFLKTDRGFTLSYPGWHLYKNKLGITNWSGTDLDFDNQGLDYLLEQCALNEFPGLVQVKFVKSHPWSYPVDISFGPREVVGISVAVEKTLRDDFDFYLRGSVCVAVAESNQYRREGRLLPRDQIWGQVKQKAALFREDDTPAVVEFSP